MPTFLAPTAPTTAAATSSTNLHRFAMLPPYPSVRVLDPSARNWFSRYPLPEWISTPSKPAAIALLAPAAKAATMPGSSFSSSARGTGYGCGPLPPGP